MQGTPPQGWVAGGRQAERSVAEQLSGGVRRHLQKHGGRCGNSDYGDVKETFDNQKKKTEDPEEKKHLDCDWPCPRTLRRRLLFQSVLPMPEVMGKTAARKLPKPEVWERPQQKRKGQQLRQRAKGEAKATGKGKAIKMWMSTSAAEVRTW